MKVPASLVLIAISSAILSGLLYLRAVPSETSRARARALPASLARERSPRLVFSLSDLEQWSIDPTLVVDSACELEGQVACDNDTPPDRAAAEFDKVEIWREFVAGRRPSLPESYFRNPPYIHPSGQSFAGLALVVYPQRFQTPEWWRSNKRYVRISELRQIASERLPLSPAESIVTQLSGEELNRLRTGTTLMLVPSIEALLLRAQSPSSAGTGRYGVFPLADWDRHVIDAGFQTSLRTNGGVCLEVLGNLCVQLDPEYSSRTLTQSAFLGTASAIFFLMALLITLTKRIRARRGEQRNRLLVLQTLTHELRTPATTLQLSLEPLRRDFDELPERSQSAFLRLCDAVQRLQKVIDASKQYLQSDRGLRIVAFREVDVPSLREFLESVVDAYEEEVRVHMVDSDTGVKVDPYWLSTIVRNLIDNAVQHGAPPVDVAVATKGPSVEITVQDGGTSPEMSLEEMTAPFTRREGSEGLGLGLAVMGTIIGAMGGSLTYEANPTRFKVTLRNVRIAS